MRIKDFWLKRSHGSENFHWPEKINLKCLTNCNSRLLCMSAEIPSMTSDNKAKERCGLLDHHKKFDCVLANTPSTPSYA